MAGIGNKAAMAVQASRRRRLGAGRGVKGLDGGIG
jgi:hypothetical protein